MNTSPCPSCNAPQELSSRNLTSAFECSGCKALLRPFVQRGQQVPVIRLLRAISSASATVPEALGFGEAFLEKYRPFKKLGEGTMGAVHKCIEATTGRKVAIKVLLFEGSPELTENFMREGRILAELDCQNIVKLVDVGHEKLRHYMVFELIDGHSIRDEVERNGLMPEKRALEIIRQVLRGLEYAHGLGVVHRDIKPENVLLTKYGYAKIADFGLAQSASLGLDGTSSAAAPETPPSQQAPAPAPGGARATLQQPGAQQPARPGSRKTQQPGGPGAGGGAIVGTPAYMAPEQAQGLEVNHLADLYSTGLMLWELLAGKQAFPGDDILEVLRQQVHETPPPVTVANPRVPSFLDGLVQRAIAKNPAERYQSAAEFGEAIDQAIERLERLSTSRIVLAARQPRPQPQTTGRPWVAIIVGLLVLLALLATQ
jgi:serine/threonine-protein kinase